VVLYQAFGVSRASQLTTQARRLGKQLSAISRSLTSEDSNPTVVTLLEMLDAMGVKVVVSVGPRKSQREPLLDVHIAPPQVLAKA
jgi:DNA-binding phage protein